MFAHSFDKSEPISGKLAKNVIVLISHQSKMCRYKHKWCMYALKCH